MQDAQVKISLYFDDRNTFKDLEMALFWLKIGCNFVNIAFEVNGVLDF